MEERKPEEFHNRNSRRIQQHLSVSADNEHSDFDGSNKSQNSKAEAADFKSTSKPSVRILSGLGEGLRLHRIPRSLEPPIKNSQNLNEEPKNEILSRTLYQFFKVRNLLRVSLYFFMVTLTLNAQLGAEASPLKGAEASLASLNKEVTSNRTFKHGGEHWLAKTPKKQKKSVNKNCKEYDVTSRAFLADLIFEGTARSRSKRASGRHVTFVVRKILKQKNNLLRPKTQIRLHFGGKANRRLVRVNPLNDCPLTSITSSNRAMANVRIGENYYVFADQFGPMNYTAKGEPIVVNKRNLKSIRSVLSRNKEKPPRVLGLQDLNLKTTQQLRLNCQVRGRPVPRINWFKDGAPLIPSSRVNVTYYRRNSTVEIKSVELKDGGVYECRATSVTGKIAKTSAHVNIWKFYTPSTTDPEKSFHIKKCPVDAYCLNGGQCYFIEHLGEHMCDTVTSVELEIWDVVDGFYPTPVTETVGINRYNTSSVDNLLPFWCEPGFKGARCEIKEVSSIDSRQPMDWPEMETPPP